MNASERTHTHIFLNIFILDFKPFLLIYRFYKLLVTEKENYDYLVKKTGLISLFKLID